MGAMNGSCIRHSECDTTSKTNTMKPKGHRRNLSATFNLSVIENKSVESSLVNINTAAEEELMTLPCVNRVIAKSIVDYRNQIGGFQRVEDLALAPGVGAAKLTMMCNEIYVDSPVVDESDERKQNSVFEQKDSEPASSVCINSANILNLLRVNGIGMTIAKNIVAYREKHGKYKNVDELLKVKGIDPHKLQAMRQFLTVEDIHHTTTNGAKDELHENGTAGYKATEQEHVCQEYILRSTSSLENILDILGPLAKVPVRPQVDKFMFQYKKFPVFRLASWNLDKFSLEKASNPGVKDVVCMTVLENGFGLVAVQELLDKDALNEVREVKEVREVTKYVGFLYDKSQNIEFIQSRLLGDGCRNDQSCFANVLGTFKIKEGFSLAVVCVHDKMAGIEGDDLKEATQEAHSIYDIISATKQEVKGDEYIVVLGDFLDIPNTKAALGTLLQADSYIQCSSSHCGTNYGSIWISREGQRVYTGISGVVTDGMFSTWIPKGYSYGGIVSRDCPVYAQLYFSKDLACEEDRPTPVGTFH